jgi:hypothetical protein
LEKLCGESLKLRYLVAYLPSPSTACSDAWALSFLKRVLRQLALVQGEAATFEKASNEAAEEFTRQSASLLSWNQMTAFMRGNLFGTWMRRLFLIQTALSPPDSAEAVSAIIIGFFAMAASLS